MGVLHWDAGFVGGQTQRQVVGLRRPGSDALAFPGLGETRLEDLGDVGHDPTSAS